MTPEEKQTVRAETIRELDHKYNSMCEKKVAAAIEHMENQLKSAEQINIFNADSIRRGRARNEKLEAVVRATSYCYRNGHINETAVIFTGLDKYLDALEEKNDGPGN